MDAWHKIVPVAAAAVLAAAFALGDGPLMIAICSLTLLATVGSAVHHAEVIAHRVGEPFGTLVLALAITAIEVALIVSMMLAGGPAKQRWPRDTIYATVMIISSGVVGICVLLGGLRHREQSSASRARARRSPRWCAHDAGAGDAGVHHQRAGRELLPAAARLCRHRSLLVWARSSSCRPCGTATTSCRPEARTKRCTPRHRRARAASASACCWWRWSRSSGWPSRCRPPSIGRGGRGRARRPWSASRSR